MIDTENIIELERRLVTTCAYEPKYIDEVEAALDDFTSVKWRAGMDRLRELRQADEPIDAMILADSVAGLNFTDLSLNEVSGGLVPSYSRRITEAACKRRLIFGLSEVLELAKSGEGSSSLLSEACKVISDATAGQRTEANLIGKIVSDRYLQLGLIAEAKARGEAAATGIPTGIEALDKHLGGIQKGICTLLAARPAMGKSTVALNFSEHASANGIGVHIFSLEDTRDAYADRAISYHSGVDTKSIRSVELSRGQLQSIGTAGEKLMKRKGWLVDDRSAISADEIVRCVRRNRADNATQMVIVDYIQLLRCERGERKLDMLTNAINTFGDAAKNDGMAYVVLSQLNRNLESRDDKRPMLSDLKECGALEERAKAVIMVYRDAAYDDGKGSYAPDPTKMELLIRKNSNGMTGTVNVRWHPERMQIK